MTERPVYENYAETIDLAGAIFGVAYQMRGTFFFAVRLADGRFYALADSQVGLDDAHVTIVDSDPVDPAVTEWRRIERAGGAPGQRMRMLSTPNLLSPDDLATVTAVGLYVSARTGPSRFDDFRLDGFSADSIFSDFRITEFFVDNQGAHVTTAVRTGNRYQLEAASAHGGPFLPVGAAVAPSIPGAAVHTWIDPAPQRFCRIRLLSP